MNCFKKFMPFMALATMLSCENNNDIIYKSDYSHGVYIVNEGSFQASNGSISYYNPKSNELTNNVFEAANHRPLGDVVQSIAIINDSLGYIIVNGSGKIEIVNLDDFTTHGEPVPVVYPRYFMQVTPARGYLTSGTTDGTIYIFDVIAGQKIDSFSVGKGPETMAKINGKIYVANSGGWDLDSTISVIDVNTDQVISTLATEKVPLDLAVDAENNIWVYCKGYATYSWEPPYDLISETGSYLQKIDPAGGNVLWQGMVGKAGDYTATPPKFAISADGTELYYLRPDGVYALQTGHPELAAQPLIHGGFYGIDVNPSDNHIYLFESSFTGSGSMKIYDNTGNPLVSGTVGIAPNGAVFHPSDLR